MMRVLFVDDEPNILRGLQRILRAQRKEWEMTFVENGEIALEALEEGPCDVVVSDMKMPGMDGADLLSKVKEKYPASIRIALSGETDSNMIYRCVQNAHQYLAKPCDAEVLVSTVRRAVKLRDFLHDDDLETIVADLTSLPSLPEQYQKIMQEMQSDDPSLQKVGQIVETDVAMAAKILQLVNSAFFGLARHFSSPAEAAMYLGVDVLKSLVLTTGVFSQFDSETIDPIALKRVWDHSTEVGTLAKVIAAHQLAQPLVLDYALMGGLMADIGKLVIAANMPDQFAEAAAVADSEGMKDFEAEQQVMGHSHEEIGAYLVGLWGLPNPVVECVAYHHAPPSSATPGLTALTAVHVADAIVCADGDETLPQLNREHVEQVGLIAAIPDWFQLWRESKAVGGSS